MDNLIKKKKLTSWQIVKKKYPTSYVAGGTKYDMSDFNPIFLVASAQEGLRFVKENQGRVIEIEKNKWEELPDELVVKQTLSERIYSYKDRFYLSVQNTTQDGQAIVELIERKRRILLPAAPWYRNIDSYRSGLPVIISSVVYIFIMMSALVSCIGEDDLDSITPDDSSEVLQALDPIEKPIIKEIVEKPKLQSTRLGDIEVKSLKNESETENLGDYAFISTTKNKITSYNLIKFFVKDISKLAGTDYLLIDLQDGTALYKVAGASMLTYGPYESGNDRLSSKWEDIIVDPTGETVIGELYDGIDLSRALFPNIQEPEVSEPVEAEPEVVVETPEVVEEPEVSIDTPQFEFFANCTELKAVHPNGVDSSHPAYQSKMDRDKDGFACD
ncbi:excalibur calcium-binding domain-containing protein [Exiguobacterium chiriqhucha]|uniref:Excalibur calcium-binding domain-containing protein n=1 Tax=Exiguobacterium chiriqhucha RW-2 TaxID=1345023 RepID=U1N217_9BACL|nr:excalibur calcium-binding domain-containing protein [Exiguobacterium chiriqhucha]ERG68021.1 hypothetical protein M467_12090 [Exiguobacterium chiriqhucha RW-2]